MLSDEISRLWHVDRLAGVKGAKSPNVPSDPLRFPGVELKTEYSSAKRGVQEPGSGSLKVP